MDWLEDRRIKWTSLVTYIYDEESLVTDITFLQGSEQYHGTLSSLLLGVCTAAKTEIDESPILSKHSYMFNWLYRDSIPKAIGFYLSEQSSEWMLNTRLFEEEPLRTIYSDEGVMLCLGLLTDLSVIMLYSLELNVDPERKVNTIWVVRTLTSALDKQNLFQRHHVDRDLPSYILCKPHTFTRFYARPEPPLQDDAVEDRICSKVPSTASKIMSADELYYKPCKCKICEPPESYRWITILLEYFGHNLVSNINGFQALVRILNFVNEPEKLKLEVVEVLLHFVSVALEFLKDEIASSFFDPCINILRFISSGDNCEHIVHSIGAVSMILKHLRSILKSFLQQEVAERMVEEGQKSMQEQLLATFSATAQPPKQASFSGPKSVAETSSPLVDPPKKSSLDCDRRSSFKRRQSEIV